MKILHFAFENFQDVPGLLSRSHKLFGDKSELVTMAASRLGFPDGICLNYPLFHSSGIRRLRRMTGRDNVVVPENELTLKIRGRGLRSRAFYRGRDLVWEYTLHRAWRKYDLEDYDIYHFDGDMPFIFGDRILKKLESRGKKIVTHFFGSELRKWGMNPFLREHAGLRFTSEVDHPKIDPGLIFVPIPFESEAIIPRTAENKVLVVGHSPTRRNVKGTADILRAVQTVQAEIQFEFRLIEGVSHCRCMHLKSGCDIGIDQVGNYGGTAYGRSGLEFLALGIPTITEIPGEYEPLLASHPFVKATKHNLAEVLKKLLVDAELRREKKAEGIKWVRKFVHPRRVMQQIYDEYRRVGWK